MIIGLTGGVGSGKTTAMRLFQARGLPCLDTDDHILALYQPGTEVFSAIVEHAGERVLAEGKIDRNKLRPIQLPDWIEKMIVLSLWAAVVRLERPGPVIFTCARMLDEGFPVDRVCTVTCSFACQRERAMRRGMDAAIFDSIYRNQMSNDDRVHHSDDVIQNEAGVENLEEQVTRLVSQYRLLESSHATPDRAWDGMPRL